MKKAACILLIAVMMFGMSGFAYAKDETVTIEYPENLQELGYTEPLVLDGVPERVVCMSTSPVLALYELGVEMVAIPSSGVVEWPEDLLEKAELLQAGMNSAFDIETVIALEPDLVIMPYASEETYGIVLESVNIPVYYVDAGHTVAYESIKAQTQALIDAFAPDSEEGEAIMQRFSDLEERLSAVQEKLEGKTCMILQSAPPSHYIQTEEGTLGSMARMIGLTNVYENDISAMVEIDYEMLLSYAPDLVLAVGASSSAEEHEALMKEDFDKNPDFWYSIDAIRDGDILFLPITFISSAGLSVIDSINELADLVEAHYGLLDTEEDVVENAR